MRTYRTIFALLCCMLLVSSPGWAADEVQPADDDLSRLGHSQHGEAFDEGPRGKPWKMDGIGESHFPISTSDPEVQVWFDQGNTLLHSYWYYEAERAFRWCLKLEPDNAMAYWGLARSARERRWEFLQEALRLKETVSERERMYIETWAEAFTPGVEYEVRMETLEEGPE